MTTGNTITLRLCDGCEAPWPVERISKILETGDKEGIALCDDCVAALQLGKAQTKVDFSINMGGLFYMPPLMLSFKGPEERVKWCEENGVEYTKREVFLPEPTEVRVRVIQMLQRAIRAQEGGGSEMKIEDVVRAITEAQEEGVTPSTQVVIVQRDGTEVNVQAVEYDYGKGVIAIRA